MRTRIESDFPADRFVSRAEFEDYRAENRPQLDTRYAQELEFASKEPAVTRAGTCGPCERRTVFTSRTSDGELQPDGSRLPNWREQLACDCEDRLANLPRALLHFVASVSAAQPWWRALLFGPPAPTDRRIAGIVGTVSAVERLTDAHLLPAASGSFHLAVASEALHRVPPLDAALAEIRRVLSPGGQFVFTVPFRYGAAATKSSLDRLPRGDGMLPAEVGFECHEIGWDILPRLRRAGFAEASAYVYWSRELGYFGPFNMIFGAVA